MPEHDACFRHVLFTCIEASPDLINKELRKYLFSILFFAIGFQMKVQSQTDTIINGKHYQIVEDKKDQASGNPHVRSKRHIPPVDSTFILNNKKLKYYNAWLTVGGGIQQNLSYKRKYGFAGGLDFNFHIKQHYFNWEQLLPGKGLAHTTIIISISAMEKGTKIKGSTQRLFWESPTPPAI
jgi:hypothetical protein